MLAYLSCTASLKPASLSFMPVSRTADFAISHMMGPVASTSMFWHQLNIIFPHLEFIALETMLPLFRMSAISLVDPSPLYR